MDAGWEDKVRERAYALWEEEGQPEGGSERHWAKAEEELRAEERGRTDVPSDSTEVRTELGGPAGGGPQAAVTAGTL
jgi:hypothetical protein